MLEASYESSVEIKIIVYSDFLTLLAYWITETKERREYSIYKSPVNLALFHINKRSINTNVLTN